MPIQDNWPPGLPLPVQETLPKNPKISDLPKVPHKVYDNKSCPNLIYCIWKSGRHAAMRTTCRSWRCDNCSKEKLGEMTQILADATIDSPLVYDIITTPKQNPTILKTFKRHDISALSLKFSGEIYIIASDYAEGRNWKLSGMSRGTAIAKLQTIRIDAIKRRDFINHWKPEPKYEPKKDTVIFSSTFASMDELQNIIEDYGLDIRSDFVDGDPLDVMERLTKLRSDHTIVFGETEYLVG